MRIHPQPVIGAVRVLLALVMIGSFGGAAISAAPPVRDTSYEDTTGEGKALVEELLQRVPGENSAVLGLLKIRPPEGRMFEVPIKLRVQLTPDGWHDVYETQPVAGQPGEALVVKHQGTNSNEYLYDKFRPEDEVKLVPMEGAALFEPFAGSDFYLADLGLEFLHWPSQKIVKKEMRKSRSCRVVESVNPQPMPGTYSRVLSWVDFETGGIIMAEAYDHNDRKLKEFSIRKFDRKHNQVREMEIRNDQTGSRTILELNLEVKS